MKIAKIMHNDTVDGIGICVSVWMQGCPNHCEGCHNPETWDPDGGKEIDLDDLIEELLDSIEANGVQRNLSILGGEPFALYNQHNTMEILRRVRCQYPWIKIFLWTGYTYEYLMSHGTHDSMEILSLIDVLIDGPYIENLKDISLPLRGSSNQRIMMHGEPWMRNYYFKPIDDKKLKDLI